MPSRAFTDEDGVGVGDHETKTARLNALVKSLGWQSALREAYPEMVEYVSRKPVFPGLLPIQGADILEIGPGFGQFTSSLARRAESVKALEVDEGQAAFLGERMRQEGLQNVEVKAGGGDCLLPYQDSVFDVVILNLVFEWCATRMEDDHSTGQIRLLDEIRRVLKTGGHLYIATKNRYALKYVLGQADEHYSGMRFGSALPRWLSNLTHRSRPPGWLYSWRGLKRLLEHRGFVVERSWWAIPDMRFTEALVPFSEVRTLRRSGARQGQSRSENILMSLVPAPLIKYVAPGLVFLVRKR